MSLDTEFTARLARGQDVADSYPTPYLPTCVDQGHTGEGATFLLLFLESNLLLDHYHFLRPRLIHLMPDPQRILTQHWIINLAQLFRRCRRQFF